MTAEEKRNYRVTKRAQRAQNDIKSALDAMHKAYDHVRTEADRVLIENINRSLYEAASNLEILENRHKQP